MLIAIEMLDVENIELPKLENDQKSYAGIPEAVFVVSFCILAFVTIRNTPVY